MNCQQLKGVMMRLSSEAIQSFKEIYKEKFGIELADNEAQKFAFDLLNFFKVVYRRVPVSEADALNMYKEEIK